MESESPTHVGKRLVKQSETKFSKTAVPEESPLWRAVEAGEDKLVRDLGAPELMTDFNIHDSVFGWTPLMLAAHKNHLGVMRYLIEFKALVDEVCENKNTALIMACRLGHQEAIEFLLLKRASVDIQNNNGWSALIWSAMNGMKAATTALLNSLADANLCDLQGRTALMWGARHGHLEVIEVLLGTGQNLSRVDKDGLSVIDHAQEQLELRSMLFAALKANQDLMEAAARNDLAGVSAAIQAGAQLNIRDADGWTPLMWAALHGQIDMVVLMVRHGANPNLLDDQGQEIQTLCYQHLSVGETLYSIVGANDRLMTAAKAGDWEAVEEAISCGAWVNVRDEGQRSILMWAGRHGKTEKVASLISRNANLELRDIFGWSTLHFAVESGAVDTVSYLYWIGADFDTRTYAGESLLHLAAMGDDGAMVQLLLASGADIEQLSIDQYTPLMLAARGGQCSAVRALLAFEADIRRTTDDGQTAFMLAVTRGQYKAVAEMLQGKPDPPEEILEGPEGFNALKPPDLGGGGAGPSKKRQPRGDGPSWLLTQATNRRQKAMEKPRAVPLKTFLDLCDTEGRGPLAVAVTSKYGEMVTLLLQAKADASAADLEGNSVLSLAVLGNQREVVMELLDLRVRVDRPNKAGQTPLQLCKDPGIRQMLERRLASAAAGVQEAAPNCLSTQLRAIEGRGGPHFRLRVEDLPDKITCESISEQLLKIFKKVGAPKPQKLDVMAHPITSRPLGHAYADFSDAAALGLALQVDGGIVGGQRIRALKEAT